MVGLTRQADAFRRAWAQNIQNKLGGGLLEEPARRQRRRYELKTAASQDGAGGALISLQ
jgi:hypothetical protein